jgi:hypothetical protein
LKNNEQIIKFSHLGESQKKNFFLKLSGVYFHKNKSQVLKFNDCSLFEKFTEKFTDCSLFEK